MKKLIIMVSMLFMIAVAVTPALAADDPAQAFKIRGVESGNANPSVSVKNTGDYVNLCTPIQQVANTGNIANEQGVVQYDSEAGDVDLEGSSITIEPTFDASCDQSIVVS